MRRSRVTLATIEAAAIGEAPAVAPDDRDHRDSGLHPVPPVDQNDGREDPQVFDRPRHRGEGGVQYVPRIDEPGIPDADPDRESGPDDLGKESFPLRFADPLGIVHPDETRVPREDDRRRNHGAGQCTPPRLVHAGEELRAFRQVAPVERVQASVQIQSPRAARRATFQREFSSLRFGPLCQRGFSGRRASRDGPFPSSPP